MKKLFEVKLKYKAPTEAQKGPKINSAEKAEKLLRTLFDADTIALQEQLIVLLLNPACQAIGYRVLSIGGSKGTVVDVKNLMQTIILGNASGIILAHNHPSGNMKPSEEDCKTTRKIRQACEVMDIGFHDHIILGPEAGQYYSFADDGCI